ncbi:MAG: ribonuclease H-like domain-containing protein [Lachnospiraceae bacterium]|nr:ribonuclease H-like domain-containing protein [Lachnospiraceae bacterium]
MITLKTPFLPEFLPYLLPDHQEKKAIYFDIETTGLSSQSSYVYLIGCAYEEDGTYYLSQWLCTEPAEEKDLLRLFFDKVKAYDLVIHYNGTGFDLPFLEKKAKRHCLNSPLPYLESLDLYNMARSKKHLFSLPNLKLKTIEEFFGFTRTDIFSGGDLIEVYAQFLGLHHLNSLTGNSKEQEETALGHVLLLHNAEDVKNLPSLTVLLFFRNLSTLVNKDALLSCDFAATASGQTEALTITYQLPFAMKKAFSFVLPWETSEPVLSFTENGCLTLSLPVYKGELKHFYPNPADYYYLPLEDCAMHKSVASFVEKEYRKKATAATCYTKKSGDFVPLGTVTKASASLPCFLSDFKSKYAYTPLTKELLETPEQLTALTKELLLLL